MNAWLRSSFVWTMRIRIRAPRNADPESLDGIRMKILKFQNIIFLILSHNTWSTPYSVRYKLIPLSALPGRIGNGRGNSQHYRLSRLLGDLARAGQHNTPHHSGEGQSWYSGSELFSLVGSGSDSFSVFASDILNIIICEVMRFF